MSKNKTVHVPASKKKSIIKLVKPLPKIKVQSPAAISKRLNHFTSHFIIYPAHGGYRFALFCRIDKKDSFEMMAESPKAYKLKSECIKVMKKIMYSIGDTLWKSHIVAFDHKGQEISLKIDYNVKMLL